MRHFCLHQSHSTSTPFTYLIASHPSANHSPIASHRTSKSLAHLVVTFAIVKSPSDALPYTWNTHCMVFACTEGCGAGCCVRVRMC